jgi:hypothetical protein
VHHLGINVFANGVNAQTSTIDTRGGKKIEVKVNILISLIIFNITIANICALAFDHHEL